MTILEQKRSEIQTKLDTLLGARINTINAKVAAFRLQLESEPLSQEILNTQNVLKALDDVIAYEKASTVLVTQVAEPVKQEQVIDVATVAESLAEIAPTFQTNVNDNSNIAVNSEVTNEIVGRPGMSGIELPERR